MDGCELQVVQEKIHEIRGQRVMLDFDLAELYHVETKRLKEAVRRNIERFKGDDFMFELTESECNMLAKCSRTQIASLNKGRGGNIKYAPYAFTEQGVAMLSSVLHSIVAIQINRGIIRAFVQMRTYLTSNRSIPPELEELHRRVMMLEQTQEKMQAQTQALLTTGRNEEDKSIPDFFTRDIRIIDYSDRALMVLVRDEGDERLLRFLGARRNNWLKWQGSRIAGWVFPKSCSDLLYSRLPDLREDK